MIGIAVLKALKWVVTTDSFLIVNTFTSVRMLVLVGSDFYFAMIFAANLMLTMIEMEYCGRV